MKTQTNRLIIFLLAIILFQPAGFSPRASAQNRVDLSQDQERFVEKKIKHKVRDACKLYPNTKKVREQTEGIWIVLKEDSVPIKEKNGTLKSRDSKLQKIINDHRVIQAERALPSAPKGSYLVNVYELKCDKKSCDVEKLCEDARREFGEKAEVSLSPVYELHATPNDYSILWPQPSGAHATSQPAPTGSDSYRCQQVMNSCPTATQQVTDYSLDKIGAQTAWNVTSGSSSVIIGISDDGIDPYHPELIGKVGTASNPSSGIQSGARWPGSGTYSLLSDVKMFNGDVNYDISHGTRVSMIAAGNTNNGFFKSSIGYNTKIYFAKMTYDGLLAAANAGAKVINTSWGRCLYSQTEQNIINQLYQMGVLIVASAGNGVNVNAGCDTAEEPNYPASYDHVFSVTGSDKLDRHNHGTCAAPSTFHHNAAVDLSAPSYDIPTSFSVEVGCPFNPLATSTQIAECSNPAANEHTKMGVGHGAAYLSDYQHGTSFGAPLVTGCVGLMLAVKPNLTPDQITGILKTTSFNHYPIQSQYCPTLPYTGQLGAGRLNCGAAVTAAAAAAVPLNVQLSKICGINSITPTITGGTGPFTYAWTGPNGFTSSASSLTSVQPGTYSLTVTNPNFQSGSASITISTSPILISALVTGIPANATNTGSIQLTVSGGTPGYTYSWTGPNSFTSNSEDLSNLAAGTYTVTVTDSTGCSRTFSRRVFSEKPLSDTQLKL